MTTNAQHTPGPWLRIDTPDYAEIHAAYRPSSQALALVGKPADADLIAAAPELLEALQKIATVDMGGGFLGAQACRKVAAAAILKATGEPK